MKADKERKDLLEVTENYLIEKMKKGTITAQEIAVVPQIVELLRKDDQ